MSYFDDNEDRIVYGNARGGGRSPTPICKIARESGGKVPLACLFECKRGCMEEHKAEQQAHRRQQLLDDFPSA